MRAVICAKPGWGAPQPGQTVYVVMVDGKPVGACLHFPRAVREVAVHSDGLRNTVEIEEVTWIEETDVTYLEDR